MSVFLWVCSLLFQPLLHPFFCNFHLRFINLSYSSACPRLVLSEKCLAWTTSYTFAHLGTLTFLLPFLCFAIPCLHDFSGMLKKPSWTFQFCLLNFTVFLELSFFFFSFSFIFFKTGYNYVSVLVFSRIRSVSEAIPKHYSMAWAKEQFFKGMLQMKTLSITNAICNTPELLDFFLLAIHYWKY